MRKLANIAYGSASEAQCLDLYLPKDAAEKDLLPLVVFIHGGAWAMGDKYDHQSFAWRRLARDGYAVASLNYRLVGEAPYPAGLEDCADAVRWLRAHAAEHGIDPARVALAGSSSGGHYALMMATDPALVDELSVRCVVAWFPVVDLVALADKAFDASGAPRVDSFDYQGLSGLLGHPLTKADLPALAAASPLARAGVPMPPTLVQHGDADALAPLEQSREFCRRTGAELTVLSGADHLDRGFDAKENMDVVRAFLARWL